VVQAGVVIEVAAMYPQMRKYWYYLLLKHNDVQFSPSPAPAQESMIKPVVGPGSWSRRGKVGVGWRHGEQFNEPGGEDDCLAPKKRLIRNADEQKDSRQETNSKDWRAPLR
jgi:hypothetical protein